MTPTFHFHHVTSKIHLVSLILCFFQFKKRYLVSILLHRDNHLFNWHVITQTLHDFAAIFPEAESAKQAFLAAFGHVDSPLKSLVAEYFGNTAQLQITCSIYSLRGEVELRDEFGEGYSESRDLPVETGSRVAPSCLSSRATILNNLMLARLRFARVNLLPDSSRDSVNAARAA